VRRLGELEAAVMDRLWGMEGTATVRDVLEQLQEHRRLAYTTVMSTLDNLHSKGFVGRVRDGRAFRYHTLRSRVEYRAELMRQALGAEAEREAVLTHFVGQLSDTERRRLASVLRQSATEERPE
jgi:predicted transcriptional regulator